MQPTIGRVVHYTLTATDAREIDCRVPSYTRNAVSEGQVLPAVVVAVFGPPEAPTCCNLKVALDGYGEFWATSRSEGDGPGYWSWPPRV